MDTQLIARRRRALHGEFQTAAKLLANYVNVLATQGGERWEKTVDAKRIHDAFLEIQAMFEEHRNPKPKEEPKESKPEPEPVIESDAEPEAEDETDEDDKPKRSFGRSTKKNRRK